METRVQIFAVLVTSGLFAVVFELVRRRRLMERYALLWMLSAAVLLGLAVWRNLLESVATAVGVYYAPSALFVIAFGFVLVLLLHFSLVISRLSDQNKVLAQRLGLLEQRVDATGEEPAPTAEPPALAEAARAVTPEPLTPAAQPLRAPARTRARSRSRSAA
jgi:hypothetical protein